MNFYYSNVISFGTNKQQQRHGTVTIFYCSSSFWRIYWNPNRRPLTAWTVKWKRMKLWNVQTVARDTVREICNKVLLLLAVTLFNQIKLKRALNSVNYEDKSLNLHDVVRLPMSRNET